MPWTIVKQGLQPRVVWQVLVRLLGVCLKILQYKVGHGQHGSSGFLTFTSFDRVLDDARIESEHVKRVTILEGQEEKPTEDLFTFSTKDTCVEDAAIAITAHSP
jgi:hypothetical protein